MGSAADAGDGQRAAARVVARGRVQGVGYRWFACAQARSLALDGWVRNRRDGSVEAEVGGSRARIEEFEARLRTGPTGAAVEEVVLQWLPAGSTDVGGFEIHATA